MKRAAVLIGVKNAKDLPPLQAVQDGVAQMEKWATEQGILVETISDQNGNEVVVDQIEDAVESALKNDELEQLIIYFAGHGVNLGYNEYWLLTRAIDRANQSVNVRGSIDRARYCGVKHVVLISDACRTAPQTMREQGTLGTVIFPNPPPGAKSNYVDIFYATGLGDPSLEVQDARDAAKRFRAVYTDVLLAALTGHQPSVRERDSKLKAEVVRPWPLNDFLQSGVPERVYKLTSSFSRTQNPEAIISSDPKTSWISDLSKPMTWMDTTAFIHTDTELLAATSAAMAARIKSLVATDKLLEAVHADKRRIRGVAKLKEDRAKVLGEHMELVANEEISFEATRRNAEPFGREKFEHKCGFKVRGDIILDVKMTRGTFELRDERTAVGLLGIERPTSVLLVFNSGYGTLLAAFPRYIGGITIDGGTLSDFYYEPSTNTKLWVKRGEKIEEIRELRAIVSAACRRGVFRLEGKKGEAYARRLQLQKLYDPTLALYAAHAYAVQGNQRRLDEMFEYLQEDLVDVPLDVAVLARKLRSVNTAEADGTVPFLPMLSQTWALLPAHEIRLPKGLEEIPRHLSPRSLWSLYNPDGVELLRNAIEKGELK